MIIVIRKSHILMWLVSLVILATLVITILYAGRVMHVFSREGDPYVIVLDAGHGGFDPGKVGVNGELEKDINLGITKKLKEYLEYSGANVVLTRKDEHGLYDQKSSNKKREDMHKRKEVINNCGADILVSIHQNSFPQEKYRGAQVFYYASSDNGKQLAQSIQTSLKTFVDPDNKRMVKDSNSYFILKQTNIPGVIVECGFLSNYAEAKLLSTEEYQDKIAWAVYIGIMQFYKETNNTTHTE